VAHGQALRARVVIGVGQLRQQCQHRLVQAGDADLVDGHAHQQRQHALGHRFHRLQRLVLRPAAVVLERDAAAAQHHQGADVGQRLGLHLQASEDAGIEGLLVWRGL
jgi:hypothetical protein